MIWLGEKRGYLSDWATQQWVRATGRRINLADHAWLDGPVGNTRLIGKNFFLDYAHKCGLEPLYEGTRGLIANFDDLIPKESNLAPPVRNFYERTSEYEVDAWSEWRGLFRPFGGALAIIFSRRLQQLNVPLSSLDSSKGMTSEVFHLRDPSSGRILETAWVRELHATGNVIYSGSYSVCRPPGHPSPCAKVVFPLPNGNATVVMKTEVQADGSVTLSSAGNRFGDPGFYFVVRSGGTTWARYLRNFKERIHVYAAEKGSVRADHIFWLWGAQFLHLHYRVRVRADSAWSSR